MTFSLRAMGLASACVALGTAPASAQDLEPSAAARIQQNAAAVATMMDRNHDGRISKAEFFRHNANGRRFAELDADRDGELNAEEQRAVNVGPRILR